jgi:hypothetical protein
VGFEPTVPVLERVKTDRPLDREAMNGTHDLTLPKVQILVGQVVEVQLLDIELMEAEVRVEVLIAVTSKNRKSRRNSRK